MGSTAVEGLSEKPVVDIDIVISKDELLPCVIQKLEKIGYFHQPEWSIEGGEAFGRRDSCTPWDGLGTKWMEHHLYVCPLCSPELARHIPSGTICVNIRRQPLNMTAFKRNLAATAKDRTAYTSGKSEFILNILRSLT
ncbi:GrpB family protein [Peribacillus deserti]|uniref:GrpB family protein n=1 Tax=Peribacillus deserti TaxID=673318 RepID=UPI00115A3DB2|nr:GrpB family protein [Peribacillus deserti]